MRGAIASVGCGRRRPSGFTLVEVLLALMLTGIILVATTFFIFSMGELWGRGEEGRLFDRHARSVTRFLQGTLNQSQIFRDPRNGELPLALSQPPGGAYFDEPLVSFELVEGPPFLVWPESPLPSVVCYLQLVEGEGLFLLWHSRLEVDFEDQPPRATLLSPFVTGLVYDYYDPESRLWTTSEQLETDIRGEPELPNRVRLVFAHQNFTKETVLTLPQANLNVTLF